ncbi:MAG: protein kinase, partial [Candidatus Riflebacteria bacterium]|nr:protein kinase [Candidatus Riflebacteria bacterium]
VAGPDLRKVLEAGPLPPQRAVEVARPVCLALEEAHQRGVIHRDIKPDNILEADPHLYNVADFGISKWTGTASVKTQEGLLLGTPAYVAPEQVLGRQASQRTDLYSLGVTLHELLTGRTPFVARTTLRMLQEHVRSVPRSPRSYNAAIDPALEAIVLKALAKQPVERFATAAEMGAALENWLVNGAGTAADTTRRDSETAELVVAPGSGVTGAPLAVGRTEVLRPTDRSRPGTRRLPVAPVRVAARPGRWLGLMAAVAGLAVLAVLGVRPTRPPPVEPLLELGRVAFPLHRQMTVAVSGPVPEGVRFLVRSRDGILGQGRRDPATGEVRFEQLPPARQGEVVAVHPDGRLAASPRPVKLPGSVLLRDPVCIPQDRSVFVDFVAPESSACLVAILGPGNESSWRRRVGPGVVFQETFRGLKEETLYLLRVQPVEGWGGLPDLPFKTLGAAHRADLARWRSQLRTPGAPMIFGVPPADPTLIPDLLTYYGRDPDAVELVPDALTCMAERLRSKALLDRVFGLPRQHHQQRDVIIRVLASARDPRAIDLARPVLESSREAGELNRACFAYAQLRRDDGFPLMVRRMLELAPEWAPPPADLIACDRGAARKLFLERLRAPPAGQLRLSIDALEGLARLGDQTTVRRRAGQPPGVAGQRGAARRLPGDPGRPGARPDAGPPRRRPVRTAPFGPPRLGEHSAGAPRRRAGHGARAFHGDPLSSEAACARPGAGRGAGRTLGGRRAEGSRVRSSPGRGRRRSRSRWRCGLGAG